MTNYYLINNSWKKFGSVSSVHHRNILSLVIEILQISYDQSHEVAADIFTQIREECNFRKNWDFSISSVNIMYYVSERTFYLGPKIWEYVLVNKK